MQDFRFDDSKSFAENCEAFLETLDSSDPDMAKILCDNWDALVVIVVLLRFSGELIAHSRPAISKWTGLW